MPRAAAGWFWRQEGATEAWRAEGCALVRNVLQQKENLLKLSKSTCVSSRILFIITRAGENGDLNYWQEKE